MSYQHAIHLDVEQGPTKCTKVVRWPVMSAHQTGISLRLSVACIVDSWRQRAIPTRPVVVRNEIKVCVEGSLRLFFDDAEYLSYGSVPYQVV